jgi:hypothetical protein
MYGPCCFNLRGLVVLGIYFDTLNYDIYALLSATYIDAITAPVTIIKLMCMMCTLKFES